jgi:hypothetical protein
MVKARVRQMEKIEEVIAMLNQIIEDRSVPRNIRNASLQIKQSLEDRSKDLSLRKDAAIQILDEISKDPNMPIHTRIQIWNLVTLLESL